MMIKDINYKTPGMTQKEVLTLLVETNTHRIAFIENGRHMITSYLDPKKELETLLANEVIKPLLQVPIIIKD